MMVGSGTRSGSVPTGSRLAVSSVPERFGTSQRSLKGAVGVGSGMAMSQLSESDVPWETAAPNVVGESA